jgi:hypothetical protein
VIPVVMVLDRLAQLAQAQDRLLTPRHGRRRRAGA